VSGKRVKGRATRACACVVCLVAGLLAWTAPTSAAPSQLQSSEQTYLLCATDIAGSNFSITQEPRSCIETNGNGGYFRLTQLRWKHWGDATATAKGKQQHGASPPFPIRVKLDHIVRCDNGPEPTWSYTRIKGILKGHSFHLKIPAYCD